MPEYNKGVSKFNKNQVITKFDNLKNTLLILDSPQWKSPRTLTLQKLGEQLKVVVDESYLKNLKFEQDLIFQEYNNQESNPTHSPIDNPIKKTWMTTDENYLYIWIETLKKWKRIPMSNW